MPPACKHLYVHMRTISYYVHSLLNLGRVMIILWLFLYFCSWRASRWVGGFRQSWHDTCGWVTRRHAMLYLLHMLYMLCMPFLLRIYDMYVGYDVYVAYVCWMCCTYILYICCKSGHLEGHLGWHLGSFVKIWGQRAFEGQRTIRVVKTPLLCQQKWTDRAFRLDEMHGPMLKCSK